MAFFNAPNLLFTSCSSLFSSLLATMPPSGLEPELVVTAYEGTDGDGLVQIAVQPDEADATSVSPPVVRLDFTDELHGLYLGSSAECAGRKGVNECFIGSASLSSVPLTLLTK